MRITLEGDASSRFRLNIEVEVGERKPTPLLVASIFLSLANDLVTREAMKEHQAAEASGSIALPGRDFPL